MSKIRENKIILSDESGKEQEYEVLFTLESTDKNKDYLVYTDLTPNDEGEQYIYAGIYDKTYKDYKIKPIEDENEWELVYNIISKMPLNEEK